MDALERRKREREMAQRYRNSTNMSSGERQAEWVSYFLKMCI